MLADFIFPVKESDMHPPDTLSPSTSFIFSASRGLFSFGGVLLSTESGAESRKAHFSR